MVLAVLFPKGEGGLSTRADPLAAHLFQPVRACFLAGNDKRQCHRHRRQQQDQIQSSHIGSILKFYKKSFFHTV
ncbi:hypothetical protein M104_0425 [Bacteroides fragilis str. 1007-1-F |uniref:Uncharacterized protein n=1 Tax=Bacteroides fragilis str. 1007-1-F \|nr:hypothetical protein M147_0215 [Bacteroides fragilis str. 1007-1-F \